jgi:hypothetical protein
MIELKREQKQLLFDQCIGLASPAQNAEVRALTSSNEEAAALHTRLTGILAPLNSLEPEPCPNDLAERTLLRLKTLADSSRNRLHQLLVVEETRALGPDRWEWASFARRFAAAAVFLFSASVFLPALGYLRHHSRVQQCQTQQSGFFRGLTDFMSDHGGQGPSVAVNAGAAWWKIGHPGTENHSNTRKIFRLVQGDYVMPSSFVCPGSKHGSVMRAQPSEIRAYQDFPDRDCVTYSFQIHCRQIGHGQLLCQGVVMADSNPLFEDLPKDSSGGFKLQIDAKALSINSRNHSYLGKRSGQNVLHRDGHIAFLRTRYVDGSKDDIFTLQGIDVYQGVELASCESDIFLAP